MPPKPCGDCGINFMSVAEEKLCHTCIGKAKEREERNKKAIKCMDKMKINIECDPRIQAEIEEICINKGINFSQYFLELHTLNTSTGWICNPKQEQEKHPIGDYHKSYSSEDNLDEAIHHPIPLVHESGKKSKFKK